MNRSRRVAIGFVRSRLRLVWKPTLLILLATALPAASRAADEEGFVPLFNGRDLSGWVPVNVAPETFSVRDGLIISTGIPTGTLRTGRMYENFIIELEWRHMKPKGNAGLFLWGDPITAPGTPFSRGIEVQILDNAYGQTASHTTHGDVFPIHGATMTPTGRSNGRRSFPSEERSKSSPEWNHYRVIATNGVVRLSVNGKEVTVGQDCVPRKGYLCLESEGSECHFRNLRIKELPSSNPSPEQTARTAEGFVSLYTGLDLRGWKAPDDVKPFWQSKNWILEGLGDTNGFQKDLWTEKEYGDFVLIADWRLVSRPKPKPLPVILPNGDDALNDDGTKKQVEVMDAGDSGIHLRGNMKNHVNITCKPVGSGEIYGWRVDKKQPREVRTGATPRVKADHEPGQWNRFVITMKGDRLTVELNGRTVIENAQLPGIAARGPLGLQHHGDAIEFANIFIRELK